MGLEHDAVTALAVLVQRLGEATLVPCQDQPWGAGPPRCQLPPEAPAGQPSLSPALQVQVEAWCGGETEVAAHVVGIAAAAAAVCEQGHGVPPRGQGLAGVQDLDGLGPQAWKRGSVEVQDPHEAAS